ncbi:MAG: hypothetical protein DWP94_04320 [Flavobacterium sp.]|nr:MAG: hypothetical protein DWP94_04320 [Flavobacterium sp.]
MLKNKKITAILLPIVVVIYALVFFRVFDSCSSDSVNNQKLSAPTFTPPKSNPKEKFDLLPVEKDPFLGTAYRSSVPENIEPSKRVNNVIKWPNIEYLGLVSDNNSTSRVFIVKVNGQQILMRKGDVVEDVRVIRGNNSYLRLSYQGQIKEFERM